MCVSRDCPFFSGTPVLSQERGKLHISNLASTFRGSIRIKSHEKVWRKGSVGVSRDCPIFFVYPLLSQERGKLHISNLASTFRGSIRIKAHEKFREKGAWAYPGTAHFFGYPLLSQERGKLRISNFACTFIGSWAYSSKFSIFGPLDPLLNCGLPTVKVIRRPWNYSIEKRRYWLTTNEDFDLTEVQVLSIRDRNLYDEISARSHIWWTFQVDSSSISHDMPAQHTRHSTHSRLVCPRW